MGNFGKEALTPDIQLTFTYILKKCFFWRLALTLGTGGSIKDQNLEAVSDL